MHFKDRILPATTFLAFIFGLLLTSCLSDPSGPIYRPGFLALAPSYESSAAGIVDVDRIRVVLTRVSDGTVEIDEVIAFESESDTVDLTFTVQISSPDEEFSLLLRCISPAGDTVFSAGPRPVYAIAASDTSGAVVDSVPLDYVGLGSNAMGVTILTTQITVSFGETISVTAVAFDSSEVVIEGTPIKWVSLDTTMAFFPDPGVGQLVGGRVRGTVEIEAHLLTGQTDNEDAFVEPVPNSMTAASGNNQTAPMGTQLPLPIVAQVNALDGPMADVTVLFATTDGSVADASALTDASGQASTTWTLARTAGTQTATATVQGYPDLEVSFTATTAAPAAGINWIGDCIAGGNWNDPAQWDLGRIPNSSDTITVSVSGSGCENVIVNVDASVSFLTIGSAVLEVDSGITLTVDTLLTVSDMGGLTLDSASTLTGPGLVSVHGILDWNGAVLSGTGITQIETDGRLDLNVGPNLLGANHVVTNFGTINWWSGDVRATDGADIINQPAGVVSLQGNDMTFVWDSAGVASAFVNAGIIRRYSGTGTVTFNSVFTSTGTIDIRSGDIALAYTGSLTDTVYVAWSSILDVVGTVALGTGFLATDTSSTQAPGRIDVSGNLTTTGSIRMETRLTNAGNVQVINDTLKIASTSYAGSYGTFLVNDGAVLEFADAIDINLLSLSSVVGPGTVLHSGGQLHVEGDYSVAETVVRWGGVGGSPVLHFDRADTSFVPVLKVESGYLDGTGILQVTDTLIFQSGTVRGTGVKSVGVGGVFLLSQDISKMFDGATIENYGTTIASEGYMILRNGASFGNQTDALFDAQMDFGIQTSGTIGAFNNVGTFQKSGGTGSTPVDVPFVNTGVVDVQSGTITFNSDFTHSDGAIIQGNGTINLSTANVLAFDGDVNPGTSPGILNFTGDAFMSSLSTANVELGGTTVGTEYDQANIGGTMSLGGTANVSLINGFVPAVGNSFTVLTFTGRTGTFQNITGLDVGGGVVLDTVWTATSLTLVAEDAIPPAIVWAGDSAGGLSTGLLSANPDGSGRALLWETFQMGRGMWHPRWSPDRSRIALSYGAIGSPNQLYVMSATADEVRGLVNDTSAFRPRWSPDGVHLAFECGPGYDNDVCVVGDVTGAIPVLPQNLYDVVTDFDVINFPNGPGSFVWDPLNPDRIAVVRDTMGGSYSMIYTMLYDGTARQRLTTADFLDAGNGALQIQGPMDWSPDGSWIVFAGQDPGFEVHIYRINRDGTGLTQLTSGALNYDGSPLFSPDGSEILFGRDSECSYDLWLMNSDGTNLRQITNEQICDYPTDRFGADWSPDGSEIVLTGFETVGVVGSLAIFKVPSTVTMATYSTLRELVGRVGMTAGEILDIQPSWRP